MISVAMAALAVVLGAQVLLVWYRFRALEREHRELEALLAQRTREWQAEKDRADAARASAEQANAALSACRAGIGESPAAPPAVTWPAPNGNGAPAAPAPLRLALRVLLVDPALGSRVVMQSLLQGVVPQLDAVDTGAAAFRVLEWRRHDVLLIDVDVPGTDSLEAVGRIRRREQQLGLRHLPILAITAHASEPTIARVLAAGCDGHLPRPIRRQTLVDALRSVALRAHRTNPKSQIRNFKSQHGGNGGGSDARATFAVDVPEHPLRVAVPSEMTILVPDYLASLRVQLTKALAAFDAGDAEPLRRMAHSLKGSGSSFGLDYVSALGARLEDQAIRRAVADAHAVARTIDEYLERIEVVAEGSLT